MERDVEKYCKICYGCQLVSCFIFLEFIRIIFLFIGLWRDLVIDLFGLFFIGEFILVVVDYYSWYYEVDILKFIVVFKVILSLEEMFV